MAPTKDDVSAVEEMKEDCESFNMPRDIIQYIGLSDLDLEKTLRQNDKDITWLEAEISKYMRHDDLGLKLDQSIKRENSPDMIAAKEDSFRFPQGNLIFLRTIVGFMSNQDAIEGRIRGLILDLLALLERMKSAKKEWPTSDVTQQSEANDKEKETYKDFNKESYMVGTLREVYFASYREELDSEVFMRHVSSFLYMMTEKDNKKTPK